MCYILVDSYSYDDKYIGEYSTKEKAIEAAKAYTTKQLDYLDSDSYECDIYHNGKSIFTVVLELETVYTFNC